MLFYPFKIFNFHFKTFNLLLFGFFAKQAAAPELPLYRQLVQMSKVERRQVKVKAQTGPGIPLPLNLSKTAI